MFSKRMLLNYSNNIMYYGKKNVNYTKSNIIGILIQHNIHDISGAQG